MNSNLNIGFAHCFMREEAQEPLKNILLRSLPCDFNPSRLSVDIFCPLAHKNEITPPELVQNKIYPVQFTIQVIQKMLEKWQEKTHVVIVSNLIYQSLEKALINMDNIRNINSVNGILFLLTIHLKEFFEQSGIVFDGNNFYQERDLIEKTDIFIGKNRLNFS